MRNGAHQHRYSTGEAGIYAFSRLHRSQQREYVVVLNNSESEQTAAIPTYVANGAFTRIYGSGPQQLTSNGDRLLSVTVPALSTVVYESVRQIPRSNAAPRISLNTPEPAAETNSRMLVSADVSGSSFNEVTFYAKVGKGDWKSIGTDDTRPYRVFHDVNWDPRRDGRGLPRGRPGQRRPHPGELASSGRSSRRRSSPSSCPPRAPNVFGTIEVRVLADPERASHVVQIQRRLDGGIGRPWRPTVVADLQLLRRPVVGAGRDHHPVPGHPRGAGRHPGGQRGPDRHRVAPVPLVNSVTVAGSLQSEIGCPARLGSGLRGQPSHLRHHRRPVEGDLHAAGRRL